MRKFWGLVQWTVGGLAPLLLIGSASAAVISGAVTGGNAGGVFVHLAPPQMVGADNFNTNNLYAMDEKQGVVLGSSLMTDIGGVIAAGTKVSSHLVWFDPATSRTIEGTVKFMGKVLGVIFKTSSLNATNGLLGDAGTTYNNMPGWGMTPAANEGVTFVGDEITFMSAANTPGDYARIITTVPEPGSVAILGACTVGLIVSGIRRRRSLGRA